MTVSLLLALLVVTVVAACFDAREARREKTLERLPCEVAERMRQHNG